MTDLCKTCGKTGSSILMNCKRCKSVAYCSAECQRRDWKDHKPTCQRKEFAGAPCDCCGSTENVEGGDFCLKCGYHYCKACNEEHRTLDIDGDVASFAPCPSCQQKRDFISPSDCTKFEKLIKERPSDPRLANWLVTLGSRILLFDDTPRGEQKAKEHFVRAGELGYGEGFSCVAEINIGARNWDEARRFYLLAADKFHVIAIGNLACEASCGFFHFDSSFRYGEVIQEDQRRPPNLEEAFRLYREGARLGHAGCCSRLGFCYHEGLGTAENSSRAFKWSKKAAEKGDADGMRQCADCYRLGYGVEQSNEQAIYWYEKYLEFEKHDEDAQSTLRAMLSSAPSPPPGRVLVLPYVVVGVIYLLLEVVNFMARSSSEPVPG